LGGFPHWEVELNHQTYRLGRENVDGLRRLVNQVMYPNRGHIMLTRYEEDSLHLYTNETRGWLMYLREPGDSGLYLGTTCADDVIEEFTCECGISLEFPRSQTLPAEAAAALFEEFVRSGRLPTSVGWEPG